MFTCHSGYNIIYQRKFIQYLHERTKHDNSVTFTYNNIHDRTKHDNSVTFTVETALDLVAYLINL